jgi:hypothetical protein
VISFYPDPSLFGICRLPLLWLSLYDYYTVNHYMREFLASLWPMMLSLGYLVACSNRKKRTQNKTKAKTKNKKGNHS